MLSGRLFDGNTCAESIQKYLKQSVEPFLRYREKKAQ